MKKKTKLFIVLGILVLLVVIIVANNQPIEPNEYVKNFEDNGRTDQPYKLNIPLHEMDFEKYYGHYFTTMSAPIGGTSNKNYKVKLPCDINYYASKEDSEPTLTLKKGTEVYVDAKDNVIPIIGYGLRCWPDYDKGWRYGYPFLTEEFESLPEDAKMYYVKSKELENFMAELYKNTEEFIKIAFTEEEYIQNTIQHIDQILWSNGVYISNDIRER